MKHSTSFKSSFLTLIFTYNDSLEFVELQKSIDIVNMWLKWVLFFLNIDKCKILHIGSNKYQDHKTIYFVLQFNLLTWKMIWVLVNFNLNWNQNITKICLNANYWHKMLYTCFLFKLIEAIKKLYTSLIRTKLEYAAVIWNPYTVKCVGSL